MSSERTLPGGIALSGGAPYADPNWHLWMNANLLKLSTLFALRVLSRVTTLPVSPTDGDIYIVPDGDANEKTVAVRDNGAWTYISAFAGLAAYVIDEDADYTFDGTNWVLGSSVGATTFLGLSDTPANFTGAANKLVAVNSAANGLEFVDAPPGGSSILTENAQTGASYTFVLADADNKVVSGENVSAINFTVPANSSVSYSVGAQINVWQKGVGQITIVADAGVTIEYPASASLKLREQGSWATLVKTATDTWSLIGDLEGAAGGTLAASDVSYDNATSGLVAADVQAALDEIALGFAGKERGTFTPTFTFGTPGDLSVVYASQDGEYDLIGDTLYVRIKIGFTPTYTTASGVPTINGSPFVTASSFTQVATMAFHNSNLTYPAGVTEICPNINAGSSSILMRGNGSGITSKFLSPTEVPSGVAQNWFFQAAYPI